MLLKVVEHEVRGSREIPLLVLFFIIRISMRSKYYLIIIWI